MNEDLAQQIQDATFTPVRLQEGYDMGEVDQFLDHLGRAVLSGGSVQDQVDGARFTPVRLREGYAMSEVDEFLDQIVELADQRLRERLSAGRPVDPASHATHPGSYPGADGGPAAASVIEERPGLIGRLFRKSR